MDKNIKNNRLRLLVLILFIVLTISQAKNLNQLIKNYIVYRSLSCEGKDSVWLGKVAEYSILKKDFPTLQLVYISPDKQVSECFAGWQEQLIFSPKVSTETIYSYASVTKVFTSELILDLIRKGKLKLDSKLIDRLSTVNLTEIEDKRINNITIGNLLLHQGGFDRKITLDTMVSSSPWCPYRIETLSKIKLDFVPGTKSIYSNLGYCLLSEVIEESYNKNFFSIVEDSFKLNGTSIYFIQQNINNQPDIPIINKDKNLYNLDYFALSSVGGLAGTSKDLAYTVSNFEHSLFPNILSTADNSNCSVNIVRSCLNYMGYIYSKNSELTFNWRDGSLPRTTSILIVDESFGVLSLLSNHRDEDFWLEVNNDLVENIYDIRLSQ